MQTNDTVKTCVQETSGLRTCWQKVVILIPKTNKYKNLFSQARSSRSRICGLQLTKEFAHSIHFSILFIYLFYFIFFNFTTVVIEITLHIHSVISFVRLIIMQL